MKASNIQFLQPKGKGNNRTEAIRSYLWGLRGVVFSVSCVGAAGVITALHTGEPCDRIIATHILFLRLPPIAHGECHAFIWVQRMTRWIQSSKEEEMMLRKPEPLITKGSKGLLGKFVYMPLYTPSRKNRNIQQRHHKPWAGFGITQNLTVLISLPIIKVWQKCSQPLFSGTGLSDLVFITLTSVMRAPGPGGLFVPQGKCITLPAGSITWAAEAKGMMPRWKIWQGT